jgi:uncharacterized membrane protein (UPF0127 family)
MAPRRVFGAGAVLLALLVGAAIVAPHLPATGLLSDEDRVREVVSEGGETLGVVDARVADTRRERYRGLSGAASLAPGEGMVFVYRTEGTRAFVMREMDFGLDIVFVGGEGRVTAVHHAEAPPPDTPEDELRRYTGRAKWVLEVPHGWTDRRGVDVGDNVTVELG